MLVIRSSVYLYIRLPVLVPNTKTKKNQIDVYVSQSKIIQYANIF